MSESLLNHTKTTTMSQEGFLGEVKMFAGNFAPRSWAFCNGDLLPVAQNSALFSILGTIYGGDGRSTFALPDLRGRAPIHAGNGPGLSPRREGEKSGVENIQLGAAHLPAHSHDITDTNAHIMAGKEGKGSAQSGTPKDHYLGIAFANSNIYRSAVGTDHIKGLAGKTEVAGQGQKFTNMQPYLAINFIICIEGTYPSRS